MRPNSTMARMLSLLARYRCSVKLSVRYDGQSQSESEHANLIDEHARLILWQTGPITAW